MKIKWNVQNTDSTPLTKLYWQIIKIILDVYQIFPRSRFQVVSKGIGVL